MNISKENAERLGEIANEMIELLNEYRNICRNGMTPSEYERFRYNTLAHLEPGLTQENTWVNGNNVQGLDLIAEHALEEAEDGEDCEECGDILDEERHCTNSDCPLYFSKCVECDEKSHDGPCGEA